MGSLIGKQTAKPKYSTDEAGMTEDAKKYAKKDFAQTLELFEVLGLEYDEETIAKALITVKYNRISKARIERKSYFD